MTRDALRAAARNIDAYFQKFHSLFGRREAQDHARVYLKGLLSTTRRKTCEAIALRFAETRDGAHVGDVFMSLIHTCELCGANPFDYPTELEGHAAELAAGPELWMPWNYRQTLDALTTPPVTAR